MPDRVTLSALRRAHCTLRVSFLAYLRHATPYVAPGEEAKLRLLEDLISRQLDLAERLASLVRERGDEEPSCDFPAEFTSAHDLAIDYALRRAAEDQERRVERLADLRDEQADPEVDAELEDILHEAEAIADQLEKATAAPAGAR